MNITNDREVMIFKNDDGKYIVGISKKNGDKYENAYFPIQFNKGVELQDRTLIKINNAWLSFYNWTYQDKKGTKFFIKCNDFEIVGAKEKTDAEILCEVVNKDDVYSDFGKSIEITEDSLPF